MNICCCVYASLVHSMQTESLNVLAWKLCHPSSETADLLWCAGQNCRLGSSHKKWKVSVRQLMKLWLSHRLCLNASVKLCVSWKPPYLNNSCYCVLIGAEIWPWMSQRLKKEMVQDLPRRPLHCDASPSQLIVITVLVSWSWVVVVHLMWHIELLLDMDHCALFAFK